MTKKTDLWMPLFIGDYVRDTPHLTRDQHGAYLLLLMAYWMRGSALEDNNRQLAQIAKASAQEWHRIRPVLVQFFQVESGYWRHKRVETELESARKRVDAKSRAGRAGAEARYGKGTTSAIAEAQADASRTHASPPSPVPVPVQEKIKTSSFTGTGRAREQASNGATNGKHYPPGSTTLSPEQRIAKFQQSLVAELGANGWSTVMHACDPNSPHYADALALCKATANKIGKGWPLEWPRISLGP